MEYYKYNYQRFYASYHKFLEMAKIRVINAEDPYLSTVLLESVKLYPSKDITNLRFDVINNEPRTIFELKNMGEFAVWGFGEHIAIDASLAILAALHETDLETIKKNLLDFKGIKKRFDVIAQKENWTLIDDYAHHPTEIEATLRSARLYANLNHLKEITVIWQPHKYSRTLDNLDRFIECFKGIDNLIILPVWAAGEKEIQIDFQKLFHKYNPIFAKNLQEAKNIANLSTGLVIGFGAGDVTYQIRNLAKNITTI